MAVTVADINKLRQQTGAGMMDCKKALEESGGDFEKAIDYLRKKGAKIAANRQDREAKEGYVLTKVKDNNKAILLSINCETDFVAKNQDFQSFAEEIANIAIEKFPSDVEALKKLPYNSDITVNDKLMEQIAKIGEKIEIGYYTPLEANYIVSYIHPGNRLAVLVAFSKAIDPEAARNIAMQVAAMAPVSIDKNDVPQEVLERELEIAREQVKQEGKPADMVEKIAQGKLNKFFKESTLLNQEYIKDNKMTVGQYLQSVDKDCKIVAFKRYSLS
ncbi:MAG TPA: translation elongation factor Ts [Bacteroidia bacterium]|nr:translation elongation factor Ts [Bacteroidia bacterium]